MQRDRQIIGPQRAVQVDSYQQVPFPQLDAADHDITFDDLNPDNFLIEMDVGFIEQGSHSAGGRPGADSSGMKQDDRTRQVADICHDEIPRLQQDIPDLGGLLDQVDISEVVDCPSGDGFKTIEQEEE